MLLVEAILRDCSSLLRRSSIVSASRLTVVCSVCATEVFTCRVFIRGGLRDCGIANARLRAPRGGEGGGYEIPEVTPYKSQIVFFLYFFPFRGKWARYFTVMLCGVKNYFFFFLKQIFYKLWFRIIVCLIMSRQNRSLKSINIGSTQNK